MGCDVIYRLGSLECVASNSDCDTIFVCGYNCHKVVFLGRRRWLWVDEGVGDVMHVLLGVGCNGGLRFS